MKATLVTGNGDIEVTGEVKDGRLVFHLPPGDHIIRGIRVNTIDQTYDGQQIVLEQGGELFDPLNWIAESDSAPP